MKIIIKAGLKKHKIRLPKADAEALYNKVLEVIKIKKETSPTVSSPPKRKPCTLPPEPPQEVHVTVSDVECPYKHPAYRSPELFGSKK